MTKYIYIKSDGRAKVECLAQIRWNDPQQLEAWLLSWGYSCVAAPLLKSFWLESRMFVGAEESTAEESKCIFIAGVPWIPVAYMLSLQATE